MTTEELQTALRAYLVGRLGQLIRSELFDARQIDREIKDVGQEKRRIIDSIADGLLTRNDPTVTTKVAELDDQTLLLTTRKQEILKVGGKLLMADAIGNGFRTARPIDVP